MGGLCRSLSLRNRKKREMENTYTHQINETTRLVAYQDLLSWDFDETLGYGWNIETISCADRLAEINYGVFKDDLAQVKKRFDYGFNSQIAHALKLYLSLKGVAYIEKVLRGYSQGEWHQVLIYNSTPDESADWLNDPNSFRPLETFYRGDIFVVETQKLEIYTNLTNGDILERWEMVDSRAGVLIGDESELPDLIAAYELETA